jgi:Flp pilus assembly protein TadD
MPPPVAPAVLQRYNAALQAVQGGAVAQASAMLEALLEGEPRFAPARQLLGACLADLGDLAGAERELRHALSLDKRQPGAHAALADLLADRGRPAEAERAYRAALALDRRCLPAAVGLSRLLTLQGRADEAAQVTRPIVAGPNAPPAALDAHVKALVVAGRLAEALEGSRRAMAAGLPHAEAGAAQLLASLGRHEEAEAAYRAILAREPGDELSRRGLARAIFTRTHDIDAAMVVLDRDPSPTMAAFQAKLLSHVGRPDEAYALLQAAIGRRPNDPTLQAAAATAAAFAGQGDAAYAHAERAWALAPGIDGVKVLVAEASLAAGRPERAARLIEDLRQGQPLDQKLIALQALAWRLMGDPRHRALYDYDRFVRAYTLEPPKGWSTLEGFLSDLAARLGEIHDGLGEPLDQSLRGGTQTNANLIHTDEPVLNALFAALDRPVADYVAALGRSDDALAEPFLARNTGGHAYNGAWSVRLAGGGGRHVNHIHSEGWISSAFYVELPAAMARDEGREGWIRFGEPGVPTRPALEAEHHVKPEPGRLVLFPSYMWHGTVPFGGPDRRTTFAFDLVPAGRAGRPSRLAGARRG